MKISFILSLLSATGALAAILPRQDTSTSTPTSTPTATASSSSSSSAIPCPTTPANCAAKLNGHLICLNARTWCLYTDTTRYTPAFFPVDLDNACADCLTKI